MREPNDIDGPFDTSHLRWKPWMSGVLLLIGFAIGISFLIGLFFG